MRATDPLTAKISLQLALVYVTEWAYFDPTANSPFPAYVFWERAKLTATNPIPGVRDWVGVLRVDSQLTGYTADLYWERTKFNSRLNWCAVYAHAHIYSAVIGSPYKRVRRKLKLGNFYGSILAYNGGAIVAMKGKNCVAIASDKRFGVQAQTLSTEFEKMFLVGPRMYLGLPGLATDIQTCQNKLKFRLNLYELKENRHIHPQTFAAMVSNFLYEKRFGPYFVEPVIAGLDPVTFKPYVCNMDLIGCINEPEDFVVGGTCSEQLYGMCEALWEPDLGPDDLFEKISQSLVNACDRDAGSGWGAVVHIIEPDKITTKHLKMRMD
uniref:Proteasome subunit beta type-3 n=1 Tax=Timema douglasi TaxID=61478 RepID=A0A7R8VYM7_TIMDO|nr:unnamed protein product [Timema douglasi]